MLQPDLAQYIQVHQAGLTIAIVMIGITLASAAGAFFLASRAGQENPNEMQPNSLSDFGPTQAKEGAVVPIVYSGTSGVRIPGNIIYFGNLNTEAITEKQSGGKGGFGGSRKIIVGYRYYLDIWQVICEGQIEFVKTYIAGKEQEVVAAQSFKNDGTQAVFPTFSEISEFASKLPGIAHAGYEQLFVGENVSFIPTIHFVVRRILPATINNANMTEGNNPAAIIYDLIVNIGEIDSGDVDLTSFNAAADFWYSKGFGVMQVFNQRTGWGDMVKQVLNHVDGTLFVDRQGKFKLKHFDPFEAAAYGFKTQDFYDFHLNRETYYKTKNFLQGEYTDVNDAFSGRALQAQNDASIDLVGKQHQSLDLTGFSEVNSASLRIWEVLKQKSYPAAQYKFSSDLSASALELGDVVTLTHTDYQITNIKARITQIDYREIDQNKIGFNAFEMVEQVTQSDNAAAPQAGGSLGSGVQVNLGNLANRRIFELPYTDTYGDASPAYLILAARPGPETGYTVIFSTDDTNYQILNQFTTFSQHGVMAEAYPDLDTAGMYEIDDDIGLLYTPTREDPAFSSITRQALFSTNRVAIVGNEMMAFQTVTPEGGTDIRLTGVIRGLFGTPIESHSIGADIFLTTIQEQVLTGILNSDFYIKLIPFFLNDSAEEALVFNDHIFEGGTKAARPKSPARIQAVRTGNNADITIWPTTPHYPQTAAGRRAESQRDLSPANMPFDSYFLIEDTNPKYTAEFTLSIAVGQNALNFRQVLNGLKSENLLLIIGAADGTYTATAER